MAVAAHCWPARCSCCAVFLVGLQLLLLSDAAVDEGASSLQLGKPCPSLDACRAGVPNESCCMAIDDAIMNSREKCSCACRQLGRYNHGHLARDCNGRWCRRCGACSCTQAAEGMPPLMLGV